MSKIKHADGVTYDLYGGYRVESRHDGYYVVGENTLCPVNSYDAGLKMVEELRSLTSIKARGEYERG